METRSIGAGGPLSSALGFGCLALTGGYGGVSEAESIAVLRSAYEHGITLFDVADFYGGGAVESVLGRALAPWRDSVLIATRGGAVFQGAGRPGRIDGSPEFLRSACEASLRRLGVDHIDVYYLARVDPGIPVEESIGALSELCDEGKIRYLGLSEVSPDELQRARSVHPIAAVACEYSLWSRDIEEGLLAEARSGGSSVVACSPLGRGFLAGAVDGRPLPEGDYRNNHPRFHEENLTGNLELLEQARDCADALSVPLPRLALAWVLSRGSDVLAIPGTRDLRHLASNVLATDLAVPSGTWERFAAPFAHGAAAGSRFPEPRARTLPRGK